MPLRGNKVLGLAIGERSVLACELSRAGSAVRATRMAEFEFPPGVSPDDAGQLGKALASFLRQQGFSARRTVIGLPLRWAVVKPKEVPPASPSTIAGLLLLQAEREFALEPQDLVFEYAGAPDPNAARTVLLLAVQKRRVENAQAMAEAAGLTVRAVTLSAVALASETGRQLAHGGAVLHVTPGAAELSIHHNGHPRVLRHLRAPQPAGASTGATGTGGTTGVNIGTGAANAGAGAGATPTAGLGAAGAHVTPGAAETPAAAYRFADGATALTPELRQVLSLMPQNGTAAPTELAVWDGVGLGDAKGRWTEILGVAVREPTFESIGVTVADGAGENPGRYATAVALALEALRGVTPVTDLLHSRLVHQKPARVGRWTVWAVVLGVTFALAIAAAAYDLSRMRSEAADMKALLKTYDPDLKKAEESINRVTFAQGWTSQDPRALDLMYELTAAVTDGGGAWATGLVVQPDGRGTLTGRASNDAAWGALLKRLRENRRFTDVQLGGTQPAGRGSTDINFTINFRYPGMVP